MAEENSKRRKRAHNRKASEGYRQRNKKESEQLERCVEEWSGLNLVSIRDFPVPNECRYAYRKGDDRGQRNAVCAKNYRVKHTHRKRYLNVLADYFAAGNTERCEILKACRAERNRHDPSHASHAKGPPRVPPLWLYWSEGGTASDVAPEPTAINK